MPEQDAMQTQAPPPEEVLDVILLADEQETKVMPPGKESSHSPTPACSSFAGIRMDAYLRPAIGIYILSQGLFALSPFHAPHRRAAKS